MIAGEFDEPDDGQTHTWQHLALRIARADLGYVRAAIQHGPTERALAYLQYSVFVAYEARELCTRQLQIPMPELAWNPQLAAACRTSAKIFDDNSRDIAQLTSELGRLSDQTRKSFTRGWRPRLVRVLGWPAYDLSVIQFRDVPVATNVGLSFQAGTGAPVPNGIRAAGRLARDLAQGVGQMIVVLGAGKDAHRPPAEGAEAHWSWRDGASSACYAQAFSGELSTELVPLVLMLQGSVAVAELVTDTDCCSECRLASFKHRLVMAHHAARSLEKLAAAHSLGVQATTRVDDLLQRPAISAVLGLRKLRNGLVHLGMSDVPADAFVADDPLRAVIRHYSGGADADHVEKSVRAALGILNRALTDWLFSAPDSGPGLRRLLHEVKP